MKSSMMPDVSTEHMKDSAEFIAAIIEASKSQDWSTVQKMLDAGHSLLQADIVAESSLIRRLASNPNTSHVIPALLEFSKRDNGIDSQAHRHIVLEATIGCLEQDSALTPDVIAKYTKDPLVYYHDILKLAEMRRREIGHLVFEEGNKFGIAPIKPTPETVYHLCRGNHLDQAIKHLKIIADTESPEIVAEAIRSYFRAVSGSFTMNSGWIEAINFIKNEILSKHNLSSVNVFDLAVAEAIITDHQDKRMGFEMLESTLSDMPDDSAADLFGQVLISAARAGRTDIVLKACELARKKKLEKNPRYQQLLARAAGAALVKEHFSLAKVIMLMAPRFDASERDMVELYHWPVSKITRLSRALNDYKLFTDIVRIEMNKDDKYRWISALKEEYGLHEMSDAGFLNLLEHPEGLQKLFYDPEHKYNIADNFNDDHLSQADLKVFRDVMTNAKREAQSPAHGKISFFRLSHLAHKAEKRTYEAEALKQSIAIKSKLTDVLSKYSTGLHMADTKTAAAACLSALRKATTPDGIAKVIKKHLNKNPILRNKCLGIISKYPAAAESTKAQPK